MQIGILGAGNVGGALGRGWAKAGHAVRFGVRDPDGGKERELLAAIARDGGDAAATSIPEAAAFGEVVVLTVPWEAAEDALRHAGDLAGKVLLDCTNPFKPDLSGLITPEKGSAGEQVAAWSPSAKVVKIFNSTGANNMGAPEFPDGATAMLYCGDDRTAKETAHRLAADLGFEPFDAGPLHQARHLESFAFLWVSLAYPQKMGRDFAFRLMRR
jgi:hypothetical protein